RLLMECISEATRVLIHVTNLGPPAQFEGELMGVVGDAGLGGRPKVWPIRWDGTSDARVEILTGQTKTLVIADLDYEAVKSTQNGHHVRDHWQFHQPAGDDIGVSYPLNITPDSYLHLQFICRIHRVEPSARKDAAYSLEVGGVAPRCEAIPTPKLSRVERW